MPAFFKIFKKSVLILLIIINVIMTGWLFACKWASMKDVSEAPSRISLFSFTCVFAVIGCFGFLIFWLLTSRKWLSLISLVPMLLCYNIVIPVYGVHPFLSNDQKLADGNTGIKVMTWNVHLFDLGEWTRDKTSQSRILDLIQSQNPDILCLEEFYMDAGNDNEPYTNLIQQLGYPYFAFAQEYEMPARRLNIGALKSDKIKTGQAIFSKFPISSHTVYALDKHHSRMLSADISADTNHRFTVNVVHLQSVMFNDIDEESIDSVKQELPKVADSKSKSIARKLVLACSRRAVQANAIDSILDRMPHPIILAGDFNDIPSSYTYITAKGALSDAFVSCGFGLGRTYRRISPTLRIDYLFYDNTFFTCTAYGKPVSKLSDHYPVVGTFMFKAKEKH